MNIRAGLLRLWVVLSILWVLGNAWLSWDALAGNCPDVSDPNGINFCELAHEFGASLFEERVRALGFAFGPPILVLLLGLSLLWVASGFSKIPRN
jgi:hypothetical protein